jgi:hypothetical protein
VMCNGSLHTKRFRAAARATVLFAADPPPSTRYRPT